jgi:hypothetical protein
MHGTRAEQPAVAMRSRNAVVVLQNTAPVPMRILWLVGEVLAVLLLFLTAVGGFILGLLVTLLVKGGAK